MKTYTKFNDAGHGWLRVPVKDILKAGIEKKISCYSFVSPLGNFIYLEEDCDVSLFEKNSQDKFEIKDRYCKNYSSVRRLQSYRWT